MVIDVSSNFHRALVFQAVFQDLQVRVQLVRENYVHNIQTNENNERYVVVRDFQRVHGVEVGRFPKICWEQSVGFVKEVREVFLSVQERFYEVQGDYGGADELVRREYLTEAPRTFRVVPFDDIDREFGF